MFDTTYVETPREIIGQSKDKPKLIKLCKDYFEISIGVRRPTDAEKKRACSNMMNVFNSSPQTPEERIQIMMYPLIDDSEAFRMILAHEYVVYQILAHETGIVAQPYLPMLRYENQMQDELGEERRYNEAIVRQAALFQTYLRMTQDNFSLNWSDCLLHGEEKITSPRLSDGAKKRVKEVYAVRSEIGHDWRVYIEPSPDQAQLQIFAKGCWVLEELRNAELNELYENYTSESSSQRLPIKFEERESASLSVSGELTVIQRCPECGDELGDNVDICSNCGWESENPVGS